MIASRYAVRVAVVLVMCMAPLAALTGCGRAELPPEEAMAATNDAIAGLKSMTFAMDLDAEINGSVVPMSVEGVFSAPADLRTTVTTVIAGKVSTAEEILLDGVVYVKYPQIDAWGYAPLDISAAVPGQKASPTKYLSFLRSPARVVDMGNETIDGVECYHYSVEVDELAVAEEMIAEMRARGVSTDDPGIAKTLRGLYANSEIRVEIWFGAEDLLPRRESVYVTTAGDTPMTISGIMTFSGFNEPVQIAAPKDAIPLDVLAQRISISSGNAH